MLPEFYVLIGMVVVFIFWIISERSKNRYYIDRSKREYRSPVCIEKKFYYIIPEKEYIELDLLRLAKHRRGG